jgi:hypothetical protein
MARLWQNACAEPDLRTHFCVDGEIACRTRREFLARYENRKALDGLRIAKEVLKEHGI